jgi:FkbM family methyltransferase
MAKSPTSMKKPILQALRALGLYETAKELKDAVARRSPSAVRHRRAVAAFYARFIQPGDLCFDIGAHSGERTRIFLELGANVVAVEPQRSCVERLQRVFGHNPHVTIVGKALGDHEGFAELAVCEDAPEISTLSQKWREEGRFSRQHEWTRVERVPVTTLDALIRGHGLPAFCKIDVEGFERVVLKGLSQPVPLLSFEFTREFVADARECMDHLLSLRPAVANCTVGDATEWLFPTWMLPDALYRQLQTLDGEHLWGDIYVKSFGKAHLTTCAFTV